MGALKYHDMALRIKEHVSDDRTTIVTSLLNIAAVYSKGGYFKEALASYEKALQLQMAENAKCKDRAAIDVSETLQFMYRLCNKSKNKVNAQRYFLAVVDMFEETERRKKYPAARLDKFLC